MNETTFLRHFRENCKQELKTMEMARNAIEQLYADCCPFPWKCKVFSDKSLCPPNCPEEVQPEKCPISPGWQRQIAYFWPRKNYGALITKMIASIKRMFKLS